MKNFLLLASSGVVTGLVGTFAFVTVIDRSFDNLHQGTNALLENTKRAQEEAEDVYESIGNMEDLVLDRLDVFEGNLLGQMETLNFPSIYEDFCNNNTYGSWHRQPCETINLSDQFVVRVEAGSASAYLLEQEAEYQATEEPAEYEILPAEDVERMLLHRDMG